MKIIIEIEQSNNHDSLIVSHCKISAYDMVIKAKRTYLSILATLLTCKDIRLIVFTTNQRFSIGLLLICVIYRKRVRLTIHNINSWCLRNTTFGKYRIRYFFRRLLLSLTSKPFVNSINQKKYLAKIRPEMNCEVVPFSQEESFNDGYENIVVYPGSYNESRRKYNCFIESARKYPEYKWIILGIHVGLKEDYPENIVTFKDYVSPDEFHLIMTKAKFLWTELVINYEGNGNREIYGFSKDSGVSYLQQKYGIPLFINEEFQNLVHLKIGTFKFKELDILLSLKDKRYIGIRRELRLSTRSILCI